MKGVASQSARVAEAFVKGTPEHWDRPRLAERERERERTTAPEQVPEGQLLRAGGEAWGGGCRPRTLVIMIIIMIIISSSSSSMIIVIIISSIISSSSIVVVMLLSMMAWGGGCRPAAPGEKLYLIRINKVKLG